jgi:DNA-directed RNA polymerase sigma subunit (sigma70/sigma32)
VALEPGWIRMGSRSEREVLRKISRVSERERCMLVKILKRCGNVLNAHERLMLTRRFGLDGQAPQVLDALITLLGVTTGASPSEARALQAKRSHVPAQQL